MDFNTSKIVLNPQCQETRCRVCYQSTLPLISLCQCSGSIAFVHEDCILDWITKKMEHADIVQIPTCQICKHQYSAKMKVCQKKICLKLLMEKIKTLKLMQIIQSLFYLIGAIFAIFVILYAVISLFDTSIQHSWIYQLFMRFIFPGKFIILSKSHFNKRKRLIQESVVQIVQVTLVPKITIKC